VFELINHGLTARNFLHCSGSDSSFSQVSIGLRHTATASPLRPSLYESPSYFTCIGQLSGVSSTCIFCQHDQVEACDGPWETGPQAYLTTMVKRKSVAQVAQQALSSSLGLMHDSCIDFINFYVNSLY
jgi:hypothetical protein